MDGTHIFSVGTFISKHVLGSNSVNSVHHVETYAKTGEARVQECHTCQAKSARQYRRDCHPIRNASMTVSWRILNKYYNSTSPQDLYVLVMRTSEYAYAVCPPVRSKFFIWCGVCKESSRDVPASINLLGKVYMTIQLQNAPKRDRSDKAETYRDRFDMVVKIEECLFVSRCHQGRGRNVNGATRYLFKIYQ